MNPLTGINVVSLEQAVAAPLCTRRLVQAGATVWKVERPEGDFARGYDTDVYGHSSYFVWLNAGKKSIVLDLTSTSDLRLLKKMIAASDVLVQNLKPGVLDKLGIDLEALHLRYPRLISVSIAGFDSSGPGARRKAYDLLMQAESGLAHITGSKQEPGRVGVSIVDIATGMYAYEAVLEALLVRAQSGKGGALQVSLFDSVADLLSVPYLLEHYGGTAPKRVGLAHPGICPYGVFSSADGVDFILAIQNEREWSRLCATGLQDPALYSDQRCRNNETRVANREFVDDRLRTYFSNVAYAGISARLDQADIAFAPVNSIDQLKLHGDFRTQEVRVGEDIVKLPVVPGLPKPENLEVPFIGQHTQEVITWLETLGK
ncbi:MAG: CoA transferase [Gammaproteobacteria bacterium]|nr:CoA transferase [Gammaproteobacteria bacterium]